MIVERACSLREMGTATSIMGVSTLLPFCDDGHIRLCHDY